MIVNYSLISVVKLGPNGRGLYMHRYRDPGILVGSLMHAQRPHCRILPLVSTQDSFSYYVVIPSSACDVMHLKIVGTLAFYPCARAGRSRHVNDRTAANSTHTRELRLLKPFWSLTLTRAPGAVPEL